MADNLVDLGMDISDLEAKAKKAVTAIEGMVSGTTPQLVKYSQIFDDNKNKISESSKFIIQNLGQLLIKTESVGQAAQKQTVIFNALPQAFNKAGDAVREYTIQLTKLADANAKASRPIVPSDYTTGAKAKNFDQIIKDVESLDNALKASGVSGQEASKFLTNLTKGSATGLTPALKDSGLAFIQLTKSASGLSNAGNFLKDTIKDLTAVKNSALAAKTVQDNFAASRLSAARLSTATPSEILRVHEAGTRLTGAIADSGIDQVAQQKLFAQFGKGDFVKLEPEVHGIARAFLEWKAAIDAVGTAAVGASSKAVNLVTDSRKGLDRSSLLARHAYEGALGVPTAPGVSADKLEDLTKTYSSKLLSVGAEIQRINATPIQISKAFEAAQDPTKKFADGLGTLVQRFKELIATGNEFGSASRTAFSIAQKEADKLNQKLAAEQFAQFKQQTVASNIPGAFNTVRTSTESVFGKLDGNATYSQIQRVNDIYGKLIVQLATGKITVTQFNQALSDVSNKRILPPDANDEVNKLRGSISDLGTALTNTAGRTGLFARAFTSFNDQIRIFQRLATYRIFSDLNNVMIEGIRAASELGQKIALIKTITQDQPASTKEWTKSVRELSDQFGQPITEVASAGYDALSNQVTKSEEDTQKFLRTISEFARTTGSSLNDSVGIFTTAIKGFGESVEDSENIAALFFNTIDYGRVTAEGLNAVLGRTAPLARDLGVSLNEVSAAIVVLTRGGFNPQEAGTRVANFLLAFEKPSEAFKKFLSGYGVDNSKDFINIAGGIEGAIAEISKAVESGNGALKDYFPEIRKLQAAYVLARDAGTEIAQAIKDVSTNVDNYNRAKGITGETFAQKFKEETTKLQNVVTVDFATGLQKLFIQISDSIGGAANALSLFGRVAIEVGITFAAYKTATVIITGLDAAIVAAGRSLVAFGVISQSAFNKFKAGGAAAASLFGGVFAVAFVGVDILLKRINDNYDAFLEKSKKDNKVKVGIDLDKFKAGLSSTTAKINESTKEWNSLFAKQAASAINILEKQFERHNKLLDGVKKKNQEVSKTTIGLLEESIANVDKASNAASTYSKEANQKSKDASLDFERNLFESQKSVVQHNAQLVGHQGVSPDEVQLTISRIELLKNRAADLNEKFKVDPTQGDRLSDTLREALGLTNNLQSAFIQQGASSNSLAAISRIRLGIEKQIVDTYNQQRDIQAKNAADLKIKADSLKNDLNGLRDLLKKFDDFSILDKKTGKLPSPELRGTDVVRTGAQIAQGRINEQEKLRDEILAKAASIHDKAGTGISGITEQAGLGAALDTQLKAQKESLNNLLKEKVEIANIAKSINDVHTASLQINSDYIRGRENAEAQKNTIAGFKVEYDRLISQAKQFADATQVASTQRSLPFQYSGLKSKFDEISKSIAEIRTQPEKIPQALQSIEDLRAATKNRPFFSEARIDTGQTDAQGNKITHTLSEMLDAMTLAVTGARGFGTEITEMTGVLNGFKVKLEGIQFDPATNSIKLLPDALTGTTKAFVQFRSSLEQEPAKLKRVMDNIVINLQGVADRLKSLVGEKVEPEETKIPVTPVPAEPVPEPEAMGGYIKYYGEGGSLFQPKGTDTIPAMLTPGEYVMPADKTSKYKKVLDRMRAGTYAQGGQANQDQDYLEQFNLILADKNFADRISNVTVVENLWSALRGEGKNNDQMKSFIQAYDPSYFVSAAHGGMVGYYDQGGGVSASFTPQTFTPGNYQNNSPSVSHNNANFGDIHVNIKSDVQNPNLGRAVAEQIRREIRRGTIDSTFFQ